MVARSKVLSSALLTKLRLVFSSAVVASRADIPQRPMETSRDGIDPSTTSVAAQKKLYALTSLRFVAAALIVLGHSQGAFGIPKDAWAPFVMSQGVSFFFVLSGFILTYVYPSLKLFGIRRFLLARFARIWPAHITAFILLFLLLLPNERSLPNGYSVEIALAQLALVHAWVPLQNFYYSFNALSWSISTEFGFYLCFPLLIHNWRRTWKLKLALVFLIVCGMVILSNALGLSNMTPIDGELVLGMMYIHPLGRLFEFSLGMTTALAWQRWSSKPALQPLVGTLLELFVLGLVLLTMYQSRSLADKLASYSWIGSAGSIWLMRGGIPCLSFAALIFVMALEIGLISRLLSYSLLVLLGEISFSVYLVHQILIRYYIVHTMAFAPVPGWLTYTVFWLLTLLMAYVIWLVVERPCRQYIVGLWPMRPVVAHLPAGTSEPAKGKRNFRLSRSRWQAVAAVSLLLACMLPITYLANHRFSLARIDRAYAETLAGRGLPEARPVDFGQQFALIGIDMQATESGLKLELAWQSMIPQRLQHYVVVQLLDAAGTVVGTINYPQDRNQYEIQGGAFWRDIVTIPSEQLHNATSVEIGMLRPPSSWLLIKRLPPEHAGRWLIVQLPESKFMQ